MNVAKILCRCGTVIQISGPVPNPLEWLMISDEKFDEFPDEVSSTIVYQEATSVFKCNVCGRIWIYWKGMEQAATCYHPESESDS